MHLGLSGKTALVTGAGRGIGWAIAQTLAKEGCQVVAVSRSFPLMDTGGALQQDPHHLLVLDLAKTDSSQDLLEVLKERGLHPDIVVNNLGGTIANTTPLGSIQNWRDSYRLNLEVAIEINSLFLSHLREQRWGRIVHLASISALETQGHPTYCAMKAALMAYTRSLGRTLSAEGIAVSAVLPGAVMTEGGYWENAQNEQPKHVENFLKERMAIGRFGTPNEIAGFVTFLCSDWGSFVAGSSFLVDGGQGRSFLTEF